MARSPQSEAATSAKILVDDSTPSELSAAYPVDSPSWDSAAHKQSSMTHLGVLIRVASSQCSQHPGEAGTRGRWASSGTLGQRLLQLFGRLVDKGADPNHLSYAFPSRHSEFDELVLRVEEASSANLAASQECRQWKSGCRASIPCSVLSVMSTRLLGSSSGGLGKSHLRVPVTLRDDVHAAWLLMHVPSAEMARAVVDALGVNISALAHPDGGGAFFDREVARVSVAQAQ